MSAAMPQLLWLCCCGNTNTVDRHVLLLLKVHLTGVRYWWILGFRATWRTCTVLHTSKAVTAVRDISQTEARWGWRAERPTQTQQAGQSKAKNNVKQNIFLEINKKKMINKIYRYISKIRCKVLLYKANDIINCGRDTSCFVCGTIEPSEYEWLSNISPSMLLPPVVTWAKKPLRLLRA